MMWRPIPVSVASKFGFPSTISRGRDVAKHREAYWRWLTLGLRGLTVMIEEQVREQKPTGDDKARLLDLVQRLQAVTEAIR